MRALLVEQDNLPRLVEIEDFSILKVSKTKQVPFVHGAHGGVVGIFELVCDADQRRHRENPMLGQIRGPFLITKLTEEGPGYRSLRSDEVDDLMRLLSGVPTCQL